MNAARRHRSTAFAVALLGGIAAMSTPEPVDAAGQGRATAVAEGNGWRARIGTDRVQYPAGRAVLINVTLTNQRQQRQLWTTGRAAYEITVRDARTGRVVWTSLKSRPSPGTRVDLAAGESSTIREIWDRTTDDNQPVRPGVYLIEARAAGAPVVSTQVALSANNGRNGRDRDNAPWVERDPETGGAPPPFSETPTPNSGGGVRPGGPSRFPAPAGGYAPASALKGNVSLGVTRVTPGGRVPIGYTVNNPTDRPVRADFSSGQRYEIIVTDAAGKTVWHSAMDKMYMQAFGTLIVPAGQGQPYADVWTVPVGTPPGRYTVRATLADTRLGQPGRVGSAVATAAVTVTAPNGNTGVAGGR